MDKSDCGKKMRRCLIEENRLELEEPVKVAEECRELKTTTKSPTYHGNTVQRRRGRPRKLARSGENKGTAKRGKRRGRPKELPDFVPRLNENVANAVELKNIRPKAASSIIKEDQAKRRKQRQDERARAIAEQRERNRITQLIAATTQAKQKAEAHIKAEVDVDYYISQIETVSRRDLTVSTLYLFGNISEIKLKS